MIKKIVFFIIIILITLNITCCTKRSDNGIANSSVEILKIDNAYAGKYKIAKTTDIISEAKYKSVKKRFLNGHIPPRTIECFFDTKDLYMSFGPFDFQSSQMYRFNDKKTFGVIYLSGSNVYKRYYDMDEIKYEYTDDKMLNEELVVSDCKKIYVLSFYHGTYRYYSLFTLSNDNCMRIWGNAPPASFVLNNEQNILGEDVDKTYSGEVIRNNITDMWWNECGGAFIENNNLICCFLGTGLLSQKGSIRNNCGEIKSLSIDSNTLMYVDQNNDLYAYGQNAAQIIDEHEKKTRLFPVHNMNLDFDVVEVFVYNHTAYVRDNKNNIFSWGAKQKNTLSTKIKVKKWPTVAEEVKIDDNYILSKVNFSFAEEIDDNYVISKSKYIEYPTFVGDFYSNEPYVVSENVSEISQEFYLSNNEVYRFNSKGNRKKLTGVTKPWNKTILFNTATKKIKNYLFNNVPSEKYWVSESGIAYIKDNVLYAIGDLELLRMAPVGFDTIYTDIFNLPSRVVKYNGVDVENIVDVKFSNQRMFVTMKSGDVYSVLPKQPGKKKVYKLMDVGYYNYPIVRTIRKSDLLNVKNIAQYHEKYYIDKNGMATVFLNGKTYEIEGVNKIVFNDVSANDDMCFVLHENGDLYGWGYNGYRTICNTEDEFVQFNNRALVAKYIVDVSAIGDSVFFLNKNGTLYFKGHHCPAFREDYSDRL